MRPLRPRKKNPVFVRERGPQRFMPVRVVSRGPRPAGTTVSIPSQSRLGFGGFGCRGWGCGGGYYPWGYPGYPLAVAVPYPVDVGLACPPPFADGRLAMTEAWALECFAPAYQEAQQIWGPNAAAIATEVLLAVLPPATLGLASTGAEQELRRRIELAVAVLLGAQGIPTRFPRNPVTPRPAAARDIATPWIRALVTGWI